MVMTKYYLNKMYNRIIKDVAFWEKQGKIPTDVAANIIENVKAEKGWSFQKLRQKGD